MSQDDLKKRVAQAAMEEVIRRMPKGQFLGIGTGSTANWFIDLLAPYRDHFAGVVSSSLASTERLMKLGFYVVDANQLPESTRQQTQPIPIYVDGADEITSQLHMIKGGGAALTREKIVAAQSKKFVCIADESKLVETLGAFPLPVEVIPMATARLIKQFAAIGGTASVRLKEGKPLVTDNGQHIVDVTGLQIKDPLTFELSISQWPGVVTVGVFAQQKAQVCLLGTASGVKTLTFE